MHHLPPGPLGYPILGCLPQVLNNKPTFRWIDQLMKEFNTEIACIRLVSTHVITVSSLELVREIFKKQESIFASQPICMSGKLVSNGYLKAVLSPGGDQWKKMRRTLRPSRNKEEPDLARNWVQRELGRVCWSGPLKSDVEEPSSASQQRRTVFGLGRCSEADWTLVAEKNPQTNGLGMWNLDQLDVPNNFVGYDFAESFGCRKDAEN
ncbi:hypothetical protein BUALT_Bualt12G0130400 [Buddleja alternifolia]|uniref:Cytochrome P450 n=1 Tax=Buddleja alternifolia TaxID=168488 RepID=A0AAV6WQU5_9LAMI|nr:hypothetical protein BUALT_Bualt12G0130400 [Buddleja alternifolia]